MSTTIPEPSPQRVSTPRGRVELLDTGAGPAILALHGAMGGYDQSLLLYRTIAEPGYRTVAVSRPGYLGTALAAGRSPEEQANLYAATLDVLGIDKAAVMAVSGGGPSAIHLALRHPERCWALVLVSTCGSPATEPLPLSFHVLRLVARVPWLLKLMPAPKADADQAARASIPDDAMRARTLADPQAGPLLRALLASTGSRVGERLAGTMNDVEVTRRYSYPLEQVQVPTMVVHGTQDRLVPFARHGQMLGRRIPGAELVAAEGGDHVSIFTHHAQVQPRVAAFLRAHAPTGHAT